MITDGISSSSHPVYVADEQVLLLVESRVPAEIIVGAETTSTVSAGAYTSMHPSASQIRLHIVQNTSLLT